MGWVVFQGTDVPASVHFSVNGFFIGFCVLAIVNRAILKTGVHMSFQMINFSRCKPRSGISGSCDPSGFSVSRNLRAVFHRGFTVHIPTKTFGGFPFPYILCSIYFCRSFRWWVIVTSGEGNGNPVQYSRLENFMDRRAWQATVHGVTKSQTRLSAQPTLWPVWGDTSL